MRLFTHDWGEGDRRAVLVHGITADGATMRPLARALADRGYAVTAVDLRGHGASPRGDYSPAAWAADLLETIEPGADLVLAHSLGAIALWLAVDGLEPERAVYVDPAWVLPAATHAAAVEAFRAQKGWSLDDVRAAYPQWREEDVALKHEALQLWDPDTVHGVLDGEDADHTPAARPHVPSLVMLADPSEYLPPDRADRLRELGFAVATVPGAGHSIHRDDLAGFLRCLDAWLAG